MLVEYAINIIVFASTNSMKNKRIEAGVKDRGAQTQHIVAQNSCLEYFLLAFFRYSTLLLALVDYKYCF